MTFELHPKQDNGVVLILAEHYRVGNFKTGAT